MNKNFAGKQLPADMLVAVLESPPSVRLEKRPLAFPGPGELLVRVSACGICGSDLLDWYIAQKAPFVFGHEPVGVVAAVGYGVEGFSVGDRVFVHHHAPCGECLFCRSGRYVHCPTWRKPAIEPGGMSEFIRVLPHGVRADTLILPDEVSMLDGTLIEPVACAVKALKRGSLQPGEHVLVIGLGFMGQVLGRLARHQGAGRVDGSDPVPARRELALTWADHVYDPHELSPAALKSSGSAGPDLVIVTPPLPEAILQGLDCAAPGGRVLLYSPLPVGEQLATPLGDLFFREVDIISSYSAGPDDTRQALDLIKSGVVASDHLVSHIVPFAQVAEAYARLRSHDPGILKIVVAMESLR